MKKKALSLLLLLPALIMCNDSPYSALEQSIRPDTIISALSDSSLFSSTIASIHCDSGGIYFADAGLHSLIILDKRLHLVTRIERHGEGPEDLIGINDFHRDDSLFYILDDGSRSIKSYSISNKFVQTIRIPSGVHITPWNRFAYNDSLFYLPVFGDTLLSVIDKSGVVCHKFGIETHKNNIGGRIVLSNNAGIWCIARESAEIENYSYNGALLQRISYSDVPFVRSLCEKVENTNLSFVLDAYITERYLYILIANKILCFALPEQDKIIRLKKIFSLPHTGFYTKIGIWRDNALYSVNEAALECFKITI